MKNKPILILVLIVIIIVVIALGVIVVNLILAKGDEVEVSVDDFVAKVNNKYFPLTPGIRYIYKGETEEGIERTEVYVTEQTKKVMGVNTVVVWDRVWLNDELIEDTKDWYAQDKFGNVWYFGEDSKELIDGKIVNREGSWQAGVDGAEPGIIMEADPKVGDVYQQEYYKGEAEDMGEVVNLGVKIKVKYGSFENCLQTLDWSPLEKDSEEYKYYCPGIGMVYEVGLEDGEGAQLIDVKKGLESKESKKETKEPEELQKDITEAEAIAIAKKEVDGSVTDVEIERKFGRVAYVVEIDDGEEIDVIIDIETGKVLGIET